MVRKNFFVAGKSKIGEVFHIPPKYTVFTCQIRRGHYPRRLENTMGKVMFGLSVSLDGFIADKNDDPSLVFTWMGSTIERLYEVAGDPLSECGAVIMGRRSFNQIDSEKGWVFPDGTAPDWPMFVLQSQARESVKKEDDTDVCSLSRGQKPAIF